MGACVSVDSSALAMEEKEEQQVHEIPGKLVRENGVSRSCCAFTKQGRKGVNQDCMLVWEECAAQENTVLCAVFDGHGPNGHHVARKVRDCLPSLFLRDAMTTSEQASEYNENGAEGRAAEPVPEEELNHATMDDQRDQEQKGGLEGETEGHTGIEQKGPENHLKEGDSVFRVWKEKFLTGFEKMDQTLKMHPKLNCVCSGTTAVAVLIQNKEMIVGNVGDSRAILVSRRAQDGSLVVEQLTVDLKPDVPEELERIKKCRGRVFALEDEPHVARIWLPNARMPGLAMARALGDFCLKDFGLSAVPQISHRRLCEEDEFVVLATDGVWDVLTNSEVAAIVSKSFPKEEAAKSVVDAAVKRWKRRQAYARIDDCAVVCHFLKHRLTPPSPAKTHSKGKLQHIFVEQIGSTTLQQGHKRGETLESYEAIFSSINKTESHLAEQLDRG